MNTRPRNFEELVKYNDLKGFAYHEKDFNNLVEWSKQNDPLIHPKQKTIDYIHYAIVALIIILIIVIILLIYYWYSETPDSVDLLNDKNNTNYSIDIEQYDNEQMDE
jgi:uncharacterized membrane protein YukC